MFASPLPAFFRVFPRSVGFCKRDAALLRRRLWWRQFLQPEDTVLTTNETPSELIEFAISKVTSVAHRIKNRSELSGMDVEDIEQTLIARVREELA